MGRADHRRAPRWHEPDGAVCFRRSELAGQWNDGHCCSKTTLAMLEVSRAQSGSSA